MLKRPKWSKCQDAKKDAKIPRGQKNVNTFFLNANNAKMPKPEKPR